MSPEYDMIVIGSGSAGLVAASFGGRMGLNVALIERRSHLGGDCTWVGCVPSKALLHIAKTAQAARSGSKYGLKTQAPEVDMPQVRDYIQNTIHRVYEHETPEVISERGVDVIFGAGRFVDAHTLQVEMNDGTTQTLKAKKFVIATGAEPRVPGIPGLADVPYHTNLTFFENDKLPASMVTIGGGPIGMEMSQAYTRLGVNVTVVTEKIMMNDDPAVGEHLKGVLESEGTTFLMGKVERVEKNGDKICVHTSDGNQVEAEMLLIAVGRVPNVNSLDLDKASVTYTARGIQVDDNLRTTQEHIFAAGDVVGGPQFTHYAGFQGSIAARNALLPGTSKGVTNVLPWTTFTEPEAAHVGLTEAQAKQQYGSDFQVRLFDMEEGDRAQAEDDYHGFVKIVYRNGKLLGATVVSKRAGEMINEYAIALQNGWGVGDLANTIHSYPTYGQIAANFASKMKVEALLNGVGGKVWNVARKVLYS